MISSKGKEGILIILPFMLKKARPEIEVYYTSANDRLAISLTDNGLNILPVGEFQSPKKLFTDILEWFNRIYPGDKVYYRYEHFLNSTTSTWRTKKGTFIRLIKRRNKNAEELALVHFHGNKNPSRIPYNKLRLKETITVSKLMKALNRHNQNREQLEELYNLDRVKPNDFMQLLCPCCDEEGWMVRAEEAYKIITSEASGELYTLNCPMCNTAAVFNGIKPFIRYRTISY